MSRVVQGLENLSQLDGATKHALKQIFSQRREVLRTLLIGQRHSAEISRLQGAAQEIDGIMKTLSV